VDNFGEKFRAPEKAEKRPINANMPMKAKEKNLKSFLKNPVTFTYRNQCAVFSRFLLPKGI
jgi:hypothetical protein